MSMLARWTPFGELQPDMQRFRQEMNRFMGRLGIDPASWSGAAPAFPAMNLWEDEDSLYVEAELPGQKLAELEITITDENRLTLKGTRRPPTPQKAEWHRQECGYGSFERSVALPVRLDANKVDARLENGVLTIKMAKNQQAKPRKIPVKAE